MATRKKKKSGGRSKSASKSSVRSIARKAKSVRGRLGGRSKSAKKVRYAKKGKR